MNISYYYNRIKKDAVKLKQTFSWKNKESIFALKAAIASVLSMLIAYSLDLNEGYWASISSLIIMLPSAGATAKKALYRFLGTCLGALLAIFLSGLFSQNHIAYSFAIFISVTFCMYKSIFSKYSYFWFLLVVTATIIMISSIAVHEPEYIVYMAFNRWFEVSIGILVTSFLNLLIWPQYAAHEYYKNSITIRRNYTVFLESVFEQYLEAKYDFEKTKGSFYKIKDAIKENLNLVEHAAFEIKTAKRAKGLIILDTEKLTLNLNHIWDFYLSVKKYEYLRFHKSYCQYVLEIISASKEILNIKNDFPRQGKLIDLSDTILNQMEKRYIRNKSKGTNEKYEIKDVYLFQEFMLILKEFVDFSRNKMLYNNKTYSHPGSMLISYFPEEIYHFELFGIKKHINVPMLKYSMKVGFTVVAVIWLWQLFEIPSGGSNMAVAVLLILQPDIMSTYLKGLLRFLGCLCGAIIGFLFLGFQIGSTPLLCLCLIIIIYISMYIYFKGGPAISYLGLQMALAFLIAVLPEPHATTDTLLFLKRLLGIFFGVSIAWIINITVYSKDLLSHFIEQLNFLQNKISDSAEQLKIGLQDNLNLDLSTFYSSLDVLTGQKEISVKDSFYLNKYLKNIEKFFRIRHLLLTTDVKVVEFVDKKNAKIKNNILYLTKEFCENKKDINFKIAKIESTINLIEDIRMDIRYNRLTDNKTIEFIEQFCQYFVNLKRILITLSELYKLQETIKYEI